MSAFIDIAALKARVDLAEVLTRELGPASRQRQWLCPFHQERTPSFGVIPQEPSRAHCFGCGWTGDVIDFIRQYHQCGFRDACRLLGAPGCEPAPPRPRLVSCHRNVLSSNGPPASRWQQRAAEIVGEAHLALWSTPDNPGRRYLAARGIAEETARQVGLGYLEADRHEPGADWGMPARQEPLWLPAGIVFPWYFGETLWRLNIRRLAPDASPKYIGPAGWRTSLYCPEAVRPDRPAILVEGEFDALALWQAAGDAITPVATGSATGARDPRWVRHLARAPEVLVAFDADAAGEQASAWWLSKLPYARRLRPQAKDVAAMGHQLRPWLEAILPQAS